MEGSGVFSRVLKGMGFAAGFLAAALSLACSDIHASPDVTQSDTAHNGSTLGTAQQAMTDGHDRGGRESLLTRRFEDWRDIFRYETFGDEAFCGGRLGLHRAIAGAANG